MHRVALRAQLEAGEAGVAELGDQDAGFAEVAVCDAPGMRPCQRTGHAAHDGQRRLHRQPAVAAALQQFIERGATGELAHQHQRVLVLHCVEQARDGRMGQLLQLADPLQQQGLAREMLVQHLQHHPLADAGQCGLGLVHGLHRGDPLAPTQDVHHPIASAQQVAGAHLAVQGGFHQCARRPITAPGFHGTLARNCPGWAFLAHAEGMALQPGLQGVVGLPVDPPAAVVLVEQGKHVPHQFRLGSRVPQHAIHELVRRALAAGQRLDELLRGTRISGTGGGTAPGFWQ